MKRKTSLILSLILVVLIGCSKDDVEHEDVPTVNYFVFGINSYFGTTIYVDECWVIDVTELITTGITPVTI